MIEDAEPITYEETMAGNEPKRWKEAMKLEINTLQDNETWYSVI